MGVHMGVPSPPQDGYLAKLAKRDLEQRTLGEDTRAAVASLNSLRDKVFRRLNLDMIERGLFMFYYTKKHKRVLPETNFDDIVARAVDMLTSSGIDDDFLKRREVSKYRSKCLVSVFRMRARVHFMPRLVSWLGGKTFNIANCFCPLEASHHRPGVIGQGLVGAQHRSNLGSPGP